ncbi:uncharacterized protein B0H18DRAFT_384496 [Fomitopsis serialis]|uniref:uncharacterized protein n=1 Tax=Fomitopsis serialis TaxID=139415 RepID=UPI002007BFB3|nr:uncharacterized protein B0H18DRAFT_384496 [Neoantrodia serialis]KAH9925331.1 hypothetical protein B0H18DRAFT_384496 [Neoantrodia serialis]
MGLTTVYTPSGGTVTGALRIVAKASTSLPVEVCERIIEQLATEPDVEDIPTRKALLACALVSKAFYTMSRAVFCRHIAIMRWDLLQGFVKLLKGKPALLGLVESVYLSGRATRDDLRPPRASGALATFPLIFAQKLPRLHKLHICCMNPLWFYHLQSYFYDALRRFTSVTVLYLRDVTFTSANHFARLLDSLPHLEWFTCADLRWIHHGQPILQLPRRTDIKLNRLSLQTSLMSPENTRTLLEFFASSDRAAGLQRLKIGRLELSNIEHLRVGQLLHAAGRLFGTCS